MVREWKKYDERPSVDFGVDYVDGSDTGEKEEHYQYSFVGPLSMSKGCDLSLDIAGKDYDPELDNVEFIYRGIIENLIFLIIIFLIFFHNYQNIMKSLFRSQQFGCHRCNMFYGLDCSSIWIEAS